MQGEQQCVLGVAIAFSIDKDGHEAAGRGYEGNFASPDAHYNVLSFDYVWPA